MNFIGIVEYVEIQIRLKLKKTSLRKEKKKSVQVSHIFVW